ncbi:hypothetical protein IC175_18525 [Clostridioides sp. ES-S-0123-01]|uniref:hypothetical protein n=1 Tax=Clostridioides sp. ES-S-0123-01 TaxID=2770783 RepID=UPI001D102F4F|nr:hypothetical protein [Clostridioides sp. ES-S-0123-01]
MNIQIDKKVQPRNIFKPQARGFSVIINHNTFIGTGNFIFREDIATKGYISSYNNLQDKYYEKENSSFTKFVYYRDYGSSDVNCNFNIDKENNRITFKNVKLSDGSIYDVALDYKRYSYFKKLGCEFRFKNRNDIVGLFKNIGEHKSPELVGLITMIKI